MIRRVRKNTCLHLFNCWQSKYSHSSTHNCCWVRIIGRLSRRRCCTASTSFVFTSLPDRLLRFRRCCPPPWGSCWFCLYITLCDRLAWRRLLWRSMAASTSLKRRWANWLAFGGARSICFSQIKHFKNKLTKKLDHIWTKYFQNIPAYWIRYPKNVIGEIETCCGGDKLGRMNGCPPGVGTVRCCWGCCNVWDPLSCCCCCCWICCSWKCGFGDVWLLPPLLMASGDLSNNIVNVKIL